MQIFPLLAAFLFLRHVKRGLKTTDVFLKWTALLTTTGWIIVAVFFATKNLLDDWINNIISGLILLGLVWYAQNEEDFKSFRAFAYSHVPLGALSIIYGLAELIAPDYSWHKYLQLAILGAFCWIFGRAATFRKQQKEVEAVTGKNTQLEMLVAERTAELTRQKNELQQTVDTLKTTQQQLIQAEKLASLGELTAGIAHEIQNPLNFVNNFSEVTIELMDELEEEITKGDSEEITAIVSDIKQNLGKITHHGHRADSIVKGMLQHSRASNGQKEPTDINALADEYLRLAYHGLRAKDKSFNAEMITQYQEALPKISAVPQDVGRVLLNLYTNAFYAIKQKAAQQGPNFKPTVQVTTSLIGNRIYVSVKDNGTGIPEAVKGKIMQPFFTTKPTGEGTGLGLSLSYDIIVKGHGGKIDIDTQEGEYTEFIITLPVQA
ncbi:ATP-binding protein [Mucilaginibacter sp. PAMB04168]|uniref:sensor histidine kinase n=1 Tax=Mucilaginibacter sp. PAMB04168 TaxID=3138567 RepID=UPI0031F68563